MKTKNEVIKKKAGEAFIPLSESRAAHINYADIKKRVLKRFSNNEYDQLDQDLLSYNLNKSFISDFFRQEGFTILRFALIDALDTRPMEFLCKNVPVDVLKDILSSQDYDILKSFLISQAGLEDLGWYDENVKERQIEKFKCLLKIDQEGVRYFMERNRQDHYMRHRIKENFSDVVSEKRSLSAK